MDRRRFLGAAGATAATVLAGCGGGGGGSGGGSETPTDVNPQSDDLPAPHNPGDPPPTHTQPSNADWQTLANGLDGSLVLPASLGYEQARVAFNSRFDNVRPQAVARCATAQDVSEVLAFVRRFKLPVTARSGGHSYAGFSTTPGVVIDVSPMNSIQLNGTIATIGAGAKLADVYDQLTARGVSIPSGSCLSVGIAGITQGGGMSIVGRAYGLTCDRLVSARMVTANGQELYCDAQNHPDLFWALRGGGGGNFGVVTSLSFQTFPVSVLTNFRAEFSFAEAAGVLQAWMTWQIGLPDTIWSTAVFNINTEQPNAVVLSISGVGVGTDAEIEPYWTQFLQAAGNRHQNMQMGTQPYRDLLLSYCYDMTISECHLPGQTPDAKLTRNAMTGSSDFFNSVIPAEGIQAMLQAVQSRLASGQPGVVKLDTMGGAINRVPPDAMAFVHRNTLLVAQYYAYFPVTAPAETVDEAGTWATGMRGIMQPWSSGHAYQNYIDARIQNWRSAYYGSNDARLVRVKANYDPDWIFRFAQGIPPN